MGADKIIYMIRMSIVLLCLSVFCIFITNKPSAEFYISLISSIVDGIFMIAMIILFRVKLAKEKGEKYNGK